MTVTYYEGERIYFRPIEPADEPLVRKWINDPRNWKTLNLHPPYNEHREREWIEKQGKEPGDYHFGVARRDADVLIGTVGLFGATHHARKAGLGICIGPIDAQNHGFGTEAVQLALRFAFEELNLNRVELSVFDFNERAQHVYGKAGFVLEGRLREASYRMGAYRDVLRYGILRREWQALQREARRAAERAEPVPQEVS
jgi:RimJ/RimL family protein N-acetyltransferase